MSMIKCPECGNRVSTMAGTCPHCGVRIKGNLFYDEETQEYTLLSQEHTEDVPLEESEEEETLSPATGGNGAGLWVLVILALTALVGGYFAWNWYETQQRLEKESQLRAEMEMRLAQEEATAALWDKIRKCNDVDELQKFINENQGSTFEGMARDRLDSIQNARYHRSATMEDIAQVKNVLESLCTALSAKDAEGISKLMLSNTLKHFGEKEKTTSEDIIAWIKAKEEKDVIGIHYLLASEPSVEFTKGSEGEPCMHVRFTLEETINRSNVSAKNTANYKVRCTMSKDALLISLLF